MAADDAEAERWFAANVRAARLHAGLSQEALAAKMRTEGHAAWKQQTAAKVENGTRRVLLAEARALARILDVPEGQLSGPPGALADVVALREAMSRLWQFRSEAQYAANAHALAREALRSLIEAARDGGKAELLADVLASAEALLKED